MIDMKINGLILKKIREEKGYTQRELSKLTGISTSTINKWETVPDANPFPSKLQILAEKLNIKISDLICFDYTETKIKYEIKLESPRDFLKCVRNELRPDNIETRYGLIGLIQYKLDPKSKGDPDSMYLSYNEKNRCYEGESYTSKLFKQIYGSIEERSDTIFNCWSFFRMFKEARTKNYSKMWLDSNNLPVFEGIGIENEQGNISTLFKGYEDILELLNEFADLHHSLANMMPAPVGYNGYKGYDGKGNFERDNDMPDIYYSRIKNDKEKRVFYDWIIKNKEKYCLEFFDNYKSPWQDRKANIPLDLNNDEIVAEYKKAIVDAISCIYQRACQLFNKKCVEKYK